METPICFAYKWNKMHFHILSQGWDINFLVKSFLTWLLVKVMEKEKTKFLSSIGTCDDNIYEPISMNKAYMSSS